MNFNIVHKIKSKLQLLPTFILMLLMLSLFSTECNAKPSPDKCNEIDNNYKDLKVGNVIEFGCYIQNDITSRTPIKWRVLEVKDGKALLISEFLLDAHPYYVEWFKNITWENSSIRHWLNNEFINQAFSEEEQNKINLTYIYNNDNVQYGTKGGNNTQDKIFLLSLDEVNKYLPNEKQRAIKVTRYAEKHGAFVCDSLSCGEKGIYGNGVWWLRSPGFDQINAAVVDFDGDIYDRGWDVHNHLGAVRHALYINL